MTVAYYARVLKRGWALLVAGLLVCIGVALVANFALPREYTAHLTIYVSGQAVGDAAVAAQQVAQSQVLSFRQLMTEDRVLDEVITDLGLNETPADLAQNIVVSNDPETLLLDVAVTDRSPDQAARIANGVAGSFARVVSQLENCSGSAVDVPCLKPLGATFPVVTAQVLKRAEAPVAASSPRPRLNLAVGALVGLILGAAAAFARDTRGRRIRSVRHLSQVSDAPNLATFAADPAIESQPILVPGVDTERWDDFRRLAAKLKLVDITHPRKAIVLTSLRPKAGTTTTACNLAVALAAAGKGVALVDANLRTGGVAELLGVDPTIGLSTVLVGQVPLDRAMQSYGNNGRVAILAAGELPPSPQEILASEQMSTIIAELRRKYEFVVFDSPPVLMAEDATILGAKVDGALLVCRSRRASSREVAAAAHALGAATAKLLGTVLTFTTLQGEPSLARAADPVPALVRRLAEPASVDAATDLVLVDRPSEESSDGPSPDASSADVAARAPTSNGSIAGAAVAAPLKPRPSPRPRPSPTPRPHASSVASDTDVVNSRPL